MKDLAYEISEWASAQIRDYGRDTCGLYELCRPSEYEYKPINVEELNEELKQYNDKTPDSRGKGFSVVVEKVTATGIDCRIRYTKI